MQPSGYTGMWSRILTSLMLCQIWLGHFIFLLLSVFFLIPLLEMGSLNLFHAMACMLSHFSCVQLCVTLWTAAHQAPLPTGFSRQEYWSGLPFPPPHAVVVSIIGLTCVCFRHFRKQYSEKSQERMSSKHLSKEVELGNRCALCIWRIHRLCC